MIKKLSELRESLGYEKWHECWVRVEAVSLVADIDQRIRAAERQGHEKAEASRADGWSYKEAVLKGWNCALQAAKTRIAVLEQCSSVRDAMAVLDGLKDGNERKLEKNSHAPKETATYAAHTELAMRVEKLERQVSELQLGVVGAR